MATNITNRGDGIVCPVWMTAMKIELSMLVSPDKHRWFAPKPDSHHSRPEAEYARD